MLEYEKNKINEAFQKGKESYKEGQEKAILSSEIYKENREVKNAFCNGWGYAHNKRAK